jgi:hypothetical protein
VILNFKGLTARRLYKSFGVKGLKTIFYCDVEGTGVFKADLKGRLKQCGSITLDITGIRRLLSVHSSVIETLLRCLILLV